MTSSEFRVTAQMTQRRDMWNLNHNMSRLSELQDQNSSSKHIRRPSATPAGAGTFQPTGR